MFENSSAEVSTILSAPGKMISRLSKSVFRNLMGMLEIIKAKRLLFLSLICKIFLRKESER